MDEDRIVDILMDLKEDMGEIKSTVSNQGKQIGMIWSRLSDGGDHCAQGARNAVAIKWLYALCSIGATAIFGVIAFFHLREG